MKRLLPALVIALSLAAGELSAVVVAGKVTFVTRRGQRPILTDTLVWLEPAAAISDTKKASAAPAARYQVVTKGKALLPHITAVPVGSTIAFPNEDPISHNLFSLSPGNAFDLGLYRKGAGKTKKFDTPGTVNVYCNVHPNMSAVVHVMPTPHYVFVAANGQYSLDVPAGRYRLVAWNEQGGMAESTVQVASTGVTGSRDLVIDSRTFRQQQHMNKAGKPYQAPSSRDY